MLVQDSRGTLHRGLFKPERFFRSRRIADRYVHSRNVCCSCTRTWSGVLSAIIGVNACGFMTLDGTEGQNNRRSGNSRAPKGVDASAGLAGDTTPGSFQTGKILSKQENRRSLCPLPKCMLLLH